MFTYVKHIIIACLSMFSPEYSCLRMFTRVYLRLVLFNCLAQFSHACFPMFTPIYSCLLMWTRVYYVYSCLTMFGTV